MPINPHMEELIPVPELVNRRQGDVFEYKGIKWVFVKYIPNSPDCFVCKLAKGSMPEVVPYLVPLWESFYLQGEIKL